MAAGPNRQGLSAVVPAGPDRRGLLILIAASAASSAATADDNDDAAAATADDNDDAAADGVRRLVLGTSSTATTGGRNLLELGGSLSKCLFARQLVCLENTGTFISYQRPSFQHTDRPPQHHRQHRRQHLRQHRRQLRQVLQQRPASWRSRSSDKFVISSCVGGSTQTLAEPFDEGREEGVINRSMHELSHCDRLLQQRPG